MYCVHALSSRKVLRPKLAEVVMVALGVGATSVSSYKMGGAEYLRGA